MPSNSLYKETLSETEQVPVQKPTGKKGRFGMLPSDIMERKDISSGAKLVLAAQNMESWSTGVVSASHGILAKRSGVSRTQVVQCLKDLVNAGLIQPEGKPVKQVQPYRLLHPDMSGAKVMSVPPREPAESGTGKKVKLAECPKCKSKTLKRLLNIGWCRGCHWKYRVKAIAREEIQCDKQKKIG